jgi:phytoene dehydrogenase-like protein
VEAAVRRTGGGPAAVRLFDHLAKFSLGVPAAEAAVTDVVRSLLAQRHGREGFLRDGNRAMCEALVQRIERGGAEVQTRRRVSAVVVAAGRVRGVRTADGAFLGAQQVISNAGAATTARLLGETAPPELRRKTEQAVPAWGAAHSIRARRRLQDHGSIEIPVDLDHIAGIVPLSNISPALCPADWHYSLAYQALDREADVPEQLHAARAELHAYLGQDAEIFNSAVYRGSHPAAATAQRVGQHGARRFPAALPGVGGLYMVGHDMAGYGIAAEIIGDSCRRLWRKLRW